MSTTNIPVIKFLFRGEHRNLDAALDIGGVAEVGDLSNSNDLSTYLSTVPAGLVIASLQDKSDLVQIATFMKLGRKAARDCAMKIVVFNFSQDRAFEKVIAKLGIMDIVDPGINTKALKFKIDFWMKSLNRQIKKNESANSQKIKSLDQAKAAERFSAEAKSITWLDALDLEEDIWLLKNDNDCKKILSKWLVKIVGPSPYIGQWIEVENSLWRFDIKESEKDLFVPGDGAWYFTGDQKPDFVWKDNLWLISGDNFDLYFKNAEGSFSRLNSKNKYLQICRNSEFAKTKEELIIESFDKELVFKREAAHLGNLEGKNSAETSSCGPLQGKSNIDEIGGSPLEGKNETPSEWSGNLKGKLKGEEAIEHKNLEQNTSTAKEKSHWGNTNSYTEEPQSGPLSSKAHKHHDGNNLENDSSSKHDKYYKNHNEAEKYEASELGKGLHGKSSTDELPGFYDNNRSDRDKSVKEKNNPGLSGGTTTDKLHSHYGHNSKNADPREERGPEERADLSRTSEGKSSKEHRREESEHRENEVPNSERNGGLHGKSSTDKLESHYGNRPKTESDTPKKEIQKDNQASESGPTSQRSSEYNNWDGKHDSGFKSEEAKLYGKKNESGVHKEGADVLPLPTARQDKTKNTNIEKTLEEMTSDAKIISLLTHQGREIDCSLDDFFDGSVIFSTNDHRIAPQSHVDLNLKFNYLGKENFLKIQGNVSTVDSDGENTNFVTVALSEENTIAFDKFLKLFEKRQLNINEFMKKAKGL